MVLRVATFSAGHSKKVGATHYDLSDRQQVDDAMAANIFRAFIRYRRNPKEYVSAN